MCRRMRMSLSESRPIRRVVVQAAGGVDVRRLDSVGDQVAEQRGRLGETYDERGSPDEDAIDKFAESGACAVGYLGTSGDVLSQDCGYKQLSTFRVEIGRAHV